MFTVIQHCLQMRRFLQGMAHGCSPLLAWVDVLPMYLLQGKPAGYAFAAVRRATLCGVYVIAALAFVSS